MTKKSAFKRTSTLRVTFIDVGWGDSILLESRDPDGKPSFALVDSNDTPTLRSSHIFLKRFFERRKIGIPSREPIFDWVLLTHAHADHGVGLRKILQDFGTRRFWFPPTHGKPAFLAALTRYANRCPTTRVGNCEVLNSSKILPAFGDATMSVLWPTPGHVSRNENDNSIVLHLQLGTVSFVLTGDAEADGVWAQIANQLPPDTRLIKVPHHGAENGTFTRSGQTPWLSSIRPDTILAVSSHVRPFNHPDSVVVSRLRKHGILYRTDEHYHVTAETNGRTVEVQYSHS